MCEKREHMACLERLRWQSDPRRLATTPQSLWSRSTLCDGVSTVNGCSSMDEIAGPVWEMLDENREALTNGEGLSDDVNGGWLPTDEVLRARKEDPAMGAQ